MKRGRGRPRKDEPRPKLDPKSQLYRFALRNIRWISYEDVQKFKKFESEALGRMFPALAKFQNDFNNSKLNKNGTDTSNNS